MKKQKINKKQDHAATHYWQHIPGFNHALGFADRVNPNTGKSDVLEVYVSRYLPDFDE